MPDNPKLLCDENVDRLTVLKLRDRGFDVAYISEDSPGIADTEVLEIASRGSRVLLTEDKDFGDLVFRTNQAAHGVLLLRLSDLTPAEAANLVSEVIEGHGEHIVGQFAVLNSKSLRIRELGP